MNNDMPQPLERELKAFHTTHKIYFACAPKSLKNLILDIPLHERKTFVKCLFFFCFVLFFPVPVSLVIHI